MNILRYTLLIVNTIMALIMLKIDQGTALIHMAVVILMAINITMQPSEDK